MSTSSSSSEDEDLSKFASCAVSADQIEKDAQVEAKKRVIRASQRPISSAARPAAASTQQQQQDGGSDEPASTGLDLVSVKIAAALDAILARELDEAAGSPQPSIAVTSTPTAALNHSSSSKAAAAAPTPAQALTPASTPAGKATSPDADPAAAAAAVAGEDPWDDGTGVQLFRTVPKGTPCVIQQHIAEGWDPLSPLKQQQDPGVSFGAASLRQKQPLRDLIPRLSLAERSRQASKRKHDAVLAALAVDGKALRAAAAAAGYPSSSNSSRASGGSKTNMSTTAGWVKGWKRMKGQKAEGEVVDAKPWVPYEVRVAKLLGTQPIC